MNRFLWDDDESIIVFGDPDVKEHFNPAQARNPKGSPTGGQWKGKGAYPAGMPDISDNNPTWELDANEFLEKRHPGTGFKSDMEGLDPDLAKEYVAEFADLQDEFPEVAANIAYFGTGADKTFHPDFSGIEAKIGLAFAVHTRDDVTNKSYIIINKRRSDRQMDILLQPTLDLPNRGELPWMAWTDKRAVIRHEFGHAVDLRYRTEFHDATARFVLPAAAKARLTKNAVSGYALTDDREFFAESFSAMRYGNARAKSVPFVSELGQFMRDHPLPKGGTK